ncbi:hypothetical protein CIHG_03002 [Coccidioides immitis H538.4]|uniref:Uncharacterized protein n=1 Tax=Coccidioides immitis H538.4 TaxID=396776 RepID=A0A0J8UD77_COCIT|nr:hypothetical protein CIHG_03002 [Coccidioides immitis H538.4]
MGGVDGGVDSGVEDGGVGVGCAVGLDEVERSEVDSEVEVSGSGSEVGEEVDRADDVGVSSSRSSPVADDCGLWTASPRLSCRLSTPAPDTATARTMSESSKMESVDGHLILGGFRESIWGRSVEVWRCCRGERKRMPAPQDKEVK